MEYAGTYVFFLAILTPLSIVFSFGLRNSIASDVGKEFSYNNYVKARLIGISLFIILALPVVLLSDKPRQVGYLVLAIKLVDLLSELIYGRWLRDGVGYKYGISQISRMLLFLFLLTTAAFLNVDISVYGAWLMPVSMAAVFLCYDYRGRRESDGDKNQNIAGLIRVSLPLAIGTFAVSLNSSVPRFIIDKIAGESVLAVYAVTLYFISVAQIPVSSLVQIFVPRFAELGLSSVKGKTILRKCMLGVFFYGVAFILGMAILGGFLVEAVYGKEYRIEGVYYFLMGVAGLLVFMSSLFNGVMVSSRSFDALMIISFVNATIYALSAFLFVYFYGGNGGYYAFLFSSLICFFIIFSYVSRRKK